MKDSMTLQLVLQMEQFQTAVSEILIKKLHEEGHEAINAGLLSFLSQLDCGVNQASKVADNIGVSRQMVSKTVKQLCSIGYLTQSPGYQKQKQIEFTQQGELLMSSCRHHLAEMDQSLQPFITQQTGRQIIDLLKESVIKLNLTQQSNE